MKSVAMLAFVLVIGGMVGAGSMPARHGVATGQAWGVAVSTMAKSTPGAVGQHARTVSPHWAQVQ